MCVGCAVKHAISIRAPARGATNLSPKVSRPKRFQSALPRGERRGYYARSNNGRHFNPRSREGSDKNKKRYPAVCYYFNPRSREGSDKRLNACARYGVNFNPRSREGSDSCRRRPQSSNRYFNPRSREGSDPLTFSLVPVILISIRAPARGAT